MSHKPVRYPVHGEWLSVREAAERLGVATGTLRAFRNRHRDRDGCPMSLEDVCEHYLAVGAGEIPRWPGRVPKRHRVNGRLMTVGEAAAALGIRRKLLDCHMSRNRCSLAETYRAMDARRTRKAEREIMKILKGK